MQKRKQFADGTVVTWIDRQTIQYDSNGYCVLVWIDFDAGLSIGRRVIKLESLTEWKSVPSDHQDTNISQGQRDKIVHDISQFFLDQKIRCRIE